VLRSHAVLAGLLLVSAASLLFEVLLTKFFGSKLEHHFTYAIISMAMLGFGLAGAYVHLRPLRFPTGQPPRSTVLASYAFKFACSCMLSIPLFCVAPLHPLLPGWRGAVALPAFFVLFVFPFFYAGVCVSYTLIAARQRPGVVYFWDLLGAALGAMMSAWAIRALTGYGATALVGLIAAGAAVVYSAGSTEKLGALPWRVAAILFGVLVLALYPGLGHRLWGHDIYSAKYLEMRQTLLTDFRGIERSYWNAIARVDVSRTGDSLRRAYRSGIPHRFDARPIPGRFILVDGGASTRQFALDGPPQEQEWLRASLWAAPYVVRSPAEPAGRALVIGAGGGVDVLVARSFDTPGVDAVELNPDMYRLLIGRDDDPMRARYTPVWGEGVRFHNTEARHFCHTLAGGEIYDVIEASAVDTSTAVQTAANALSENFLYTMDALADYYRLLRPGGILSTSSGYARPATLTLRKFVSYLEFLDRQGVPSPGKSVAVVFDHYFENALLKKGEFSREEIDRLESWAQDNGYVFIYHPFMTAGTPPVRPLGFGDQLDALDAREYELRANLQYAPFLDPRRTPMTDDDLPFVALAAASNASARAVILDKLPWDVRPATDERPYPFFMRPNHASWTAAFDGAFVFPQPAVRWMFLAALVGALGLIAVPGIARRKEPGTRTAAGAIPFFALCGLGFILVENSAFLDVTMLVGGPLHSLAIVLPSVLAGYAVGSLGACRFRGPAGVLALYAGGFAAYALAVHHGIGHLAGAAWLTRVVASIAVVMPLGAVLGVAVPWYMQSLKESDARSLAWMWAVSSAFNVLGSMLFVPVCFALGRTATLALAAAMYLAAIAWAWLRPAAIRDSSRRSLQAPPTANPG
jgi:hypothetical protein